MGTQVPSPKVAQLQSIFGPYLTWPNESRCLLVESSDIVWDRDPATPPPKGQSPQFGPCLLWPNGCMDQGATWTEVGLVPGHIVLNGDPAPSPERGHSPSPIFGPYFLWPNGWMDQDVAWYEGRPWPSPHYVTWGPSSPLPKGAQPPIFGPCLLWPNGRPCQLLLSTCHN